MKKRCKNCKYFDTKVTEIDHFGECSDPSKVILNELEYAMTSNQKVYDTYRCGAWRLKSESN